jgi:hypothetical protein
VHLQLKLIDFGKMLSLQPDKSGVHCLIDASKHGPRGYPLAPELHRGKLNGFVDGRRTDMFRAGAILEELCGSCSLVELLKNGPASERPLASQLLNNELPQQPDENTRQALQWMQDEAATTLELLDELESRHPSEDAMALRYCHKLFLHDQDFDVSALPAKLRDSLQAAGFNSTAAQNRVTSFKELEAGETICGRITIEERRLYRGEALRPFFKKHFIDASLNPPIGRVERIPDGEHAENSEFIERARQLARRPSRPHLQNELGSEGRSRRLVQLTVRYISGTNNQAFFDLLSIVNKTIHRMGLGASVAMERKTATQKAYALLRWLRMIILSGYAYHQFKEVAFDTNFVPLVVVKLGQLLAALAALKDHQGLDQAQLECIKRFERTLVADAASDREAASESENSMQLTEDMVRQLW